MHACNFMATEAQDIVERNSYVLDDVDYLVPHQANARIIDHVAKALGVDDSKVLSNIENTGNTGSASTVICLFTELAKVHERRPYRCDRLRRRILQRRDAAQEMSRANRFRLWVTSVQNKSTATDMLTLGSNREKEK
jgi:hypothetical protein